MNRQSQQSARSGRRKPADVTLPLGHYTFIDLFAGSGAFTLGLRQSGLTGEALLIDQARDCVQTCQLNHPDAHVVLADISRVDWTGVTTDIVLAGPPCQGFSALGRRDDLDPRNDLYRSLLLCVQETQPNVVVVENVPRFLEVRQGADLVERLREFGYGVRSAVIDSTSVGTPQRRLRALISAAPDGETIPWPNTRFGSSLQPIRTVADAFALLPRVPDGKNWHVSKSLSKDYMERVRAIPRGGNRKDLPNDLQLDCWRDTRGYSDVMGRLKWSEPASTLRTEFFRPEKGRFLHPSEDRPITIREGARLQSFPDSYRFPSDLAFKTVARQIGNAIPVSLASAIGASILESRRRTGKALD